MPGETDPPASPAPAHRDRAGEGGDRTFTTRPTGRALAKDLREVRSKPERAFNVGAVLGLTLAVATFIFLVQNSGDTDFEWLWFDFTLPLWAALSGALVAGALLVLTALAVHRRRRRRIGRRERAAGRLEQALVGDEPEPDRPPAAPAAPPAGPASSGPDAAAPPAAPPEPTSGPGAPPAEPEVTRPTGPRQVRGPMQG